MHAINEEITVGVESFPHKERLQPCTGVELIFVRSSAVGCVQLMRCFLAGHLVDAKGEEVYMQHYKRLAIPITFITGRFSAKHHSQ